MEESPLWCCSILSAWLSYEALMKKLLLLLFLIPNLVMGDLRPLKFIQETSNSDVQLYFLQRCAAAFVSSCNSSRDIFGGCKNNMDRAQVLQILAVWMSKKIEKIEINNMKDLIQATSPVKEKIRALHKAYFKLAIEERRIAPKSSMNIGHYGLWEEDFPICNALYSRVSPGKKTVKEDLWEVLGNQRKQIKNKEK